MAESDTRTGAIATIGEQDFTYTRVFDAPQALVFKAFTEPERLKHWWGPQGWTLPVCTVDLRPGGIWQYCMRGPDGAEAWGKAVYREIVAPDRLVYLDVFADAAGIPQAGMPELLITVTFTEQDGQTTVSMHTQFASPADRDAILAMGMEPGLGQTMDRLDAYLTREQAL